MSRGRVLVTGAAGCIGTPLVQSLAAAGYQVRALVRDRTAASHLHAIANLEIVEGDITDAARVECLVEGIEQIFHLAACVHAPAGTPEDQFFRVNVEGTRHLATAAVRHQVEVFVHFSTVAVYGESEELLDEDSPVAPVTAYGRSKLAAEELVRAIFSATPVRATILRLPVVYGRRDRGNVTRMIEAIRRRRFLIIGDGRNEKSMVAVGNVVAAARLVAATAASRDRTYIVTDAPVSTQKEIAVTIASLLGQPPHFFHLPCLPALALGAAADILESLTGRPMPISRDRVRKLAQRTRYSAARIARELGYHPHLALREGLREMIE